MFGGAPSFGSVPSFGGAPAFGNSPQGGLVASPSSGLVSSNKPRQYSNMALRLSGQKLYIF